MLKKRDGRIRIIPIGERDVLDWFVSGVKDWKHVRHMSVPVFNNLPGDLSVESVHHDPMRRCFNFIVHSMAFEPMLDGDEIPFFNPLVNQEYRALAVTDQTPHVWRSPIQEQDILKALMDQNDRTSILIPRLFPFAAEEPIDEAGKATFTGRMVYAPRALGYSGVPGVEGCPGMTDSPGPVFSLQPTLENKCVCNGGALACDDPMVKDANHNEADAMMKFFKGS
jgi:hypothetical protein